MAGPEPNWWLSPAIQLNGVSGIGAQASPSPSNNVIDVTFQSACDSSSFATGTANILVDVYVCLPSLVLDKFTGNNVTLKLIATKPVPLSSVAAGKSTSLSSVGKAINWIAGTDPSLPDGPGHKCLVAIAYPDSETPDEECFHQAGPTNDQHYAQLNIAIQPLPISGRREPGFSLFTANPDRFAVAPATLRVEADLFPDPKVIDILTPALNATPGYKRMVRRTPKSFGVQLPDFPNPVVRDQTRWGCFGLLFWILSFLGIKSNFKPSYEADVQLSPGQVTTINFVADLSGSSPGDAHIFHFTHARSDGRVIGGLTLVTVLV